MQVFGRAQLGGGGNQCYCHAVFMSKGIFLSYEKLSFPHLVVANKFGEVFIYSYAFSVSESDLYCTALAEQSIESLCIFALGLAVQGSLCYKDILCWSLYVESWFLVLQGDWEGYIDASAARKWTWLLRLWYLPWLNSSREILKFDPVSPEMEHQKLMFGKKEWWAEAVVGMSM